MLALFIEDCFCVSDHVVFQIHKCLTNHICIMMLKHHLSNTISKFQCNITLIFVSD